jgi:hypothetical protein
MFAAAQFSLSLGCTSRGSFDCRGNFLCKAAHCSLVVRLRISDAEDK